MSKASPTPASKKVDASGWIGAILLVWAMGIAYFALWQAGLRLTDSNFTYNLDDAYIHLAIAKNFALHGVWGVTPYENASAASSPLWILLLAVCIRIVGDNQFLPLLLGITFSIAATLYVYLRFQKAAIKAPLAALAALGIFMIGPLHLLPFTGMEHCLQILLDLIFGFWLVDVMGRDPAKRDLIAGAGLAILMCLCRYESVFLLIVPIATCVWQKRWRLAISMVAGPVLGIGGFGLISVMNGMPFIPNSILLKGALPHTTLAAFLGQLAQQTRNQLHFTSLWDLWVLAILAAVAMQKSNLRAETKGLRAWIWTLVVATFLHSAFAKVGIFYRYEAYLVVLLATVVVLSFNQLLRAQWPWQDISVSAKGWVAGIVAVCCGQGLLYFVFWFYSLNFNLLIFLYFEGLTLLAAMTRPPLTWGKFGKVLLATWVPAALLIMANDRAKAGFHDVPHASQDIYLQQRQMARFVGKYYANGRLAVNDIGAVTYFNHVHLLDMVGLASDSVRKLLLEHRFTTETAGQVIQAFQPDLIIVYPDWFTGKKSLPKTLIAVGDWTIPPVTSAGSRTVVFYATNREAARRLRAQLVEFAGSLPREVTPR